METRSLFRKIALWILGALGIAPLCAEIVKRSADRNGYLDDPSKGIQWLLSKVAGITDWWLFYPLLCLALGVVMGLWIDLLFRSRARSNASELFSIGNAMLEFASYMENQQRWAVGEWPDRIDSRIPDLQVLTNRLRKNGFWAPPPKVLHLGDDGRFLYNYLRFIGAVLVDGDTALATKQIVRFQAEFDTELLPQVMG